MQVAQSLTLRRGADLRQGPLAGRYPAVAAMVMLALIPCGIALVASGLTMIRRQR